MKLRGGRGIALVAALVVAWHAPLLWQRTPPPAPAGAERGAETVFMILEPSSPAVTSAVDWMDPTVFALPSDQGFSARVRRRAPSLRLAETNAFAFSLPQPYAPLLWAGETGEGAVFVEPPPSFGEAVAAEEAPSPPSEEGSAWRVYGEIAARNPAAVAPLPPMARDEPVGPSVLRIAVTPRGDVPYAFMERGSGFDRADDAALRFVQSLHFSPVEGTNAAPLAWGFVKILWRSERPPRKSETVR
ncbi:MAG: hypothetical protein IT578_04930 [Verrucomicrobiae bacterium]|nr:hypothetical protein [Verrucomicrobiae bacterium]